MSKKNLDTSIVITSNNIHKIYNNINEAISDTGLTKRQLERRATDELTVDDVIYKWNNPSTRRSYLGKRSRRKGNNFELDVIKDLINCGYTGCVSARSESKRLDNDKIDIVDTLNELPCYIQTKNTKLFPNYYRIEEECPRKDKPFVIIHKQVNKHPVAILPIRFFYDLIDKNK